ncbi:hypothetical protein NQ318_014120 [Aromia moschata]|uniref:Uncharacterized protein n=1 Tax=Aromia moschata TaxID=1265417 RepID=A0AAV8XKW9_9CUCU|nr:hypothetical protein NQ318_014120 [Aromia moschata]
MYSLKVIENLKSEKILKKAKGVKSSSLKKLTLNHYYQCLFNNTTMNCTQNLIQSEKHTVYTLHKGKWVITRQKRKSIINHKTWTWILKPKKLQFQRKVEEENDLIKQKKMAEKRVLSEEDCAGNKYKIVPFTLQRLKNAGQKPRYNDHNAVGLDFAPPTKILIDGEWKWYGHGYKIFLEKGHYATLHTRSSYENLGVRVVAFWGVDGESFKSQRSDFGALKPRLELRRPNSSVSWDQICPPPDGAVNSSVLDVTGQPHQGNQVDEEEKVSISCHLHENDPETPGFHEVAPDSGFLKLLFGSAFEIEI